MPFKQVSTLDGNQKLTWPPSDSSSGFFRGAVHNYDLLQIAAEFGDLELALQAAEQILCTHNFWGVGSAFDYLPATIRALLVSLDLQRSASED